MLIAATVFAVLFFARFAYELSRPIDQPFDNFDGAFQANAVAQSEIDISSKRKNYASAKIEVTQAFAIQTVEQKYERISSIETKTAAWEADMLKLETTITAINGVIQRENSYGLDGTRVLSLSLGVVPDRFDEAVDRFRLIGDLVSINTVKRDRTGEFRALEAKQLSLEKTRDGLAALRNPNAALADRIDLETRILEIEGQIQDLGVDLGDFSENNSFCTINFTLREAVDLPLAKRVAPAAFAALSWSTAVFLGLVFALLGVAGIAVLAFKLWDRFAGQHR